MVLAVAGMVSAALAVSAQYVSAQTRTVKGVVLAFEDSVPLTGMSVQARGARGVSITDEDGTFTIRSLPDAEVMLSFSRLGVAPDSVAVAQTVSTVTVYLSTSAVELSGFQCRYELSNLGTLQFHG